MLVGKVLEWVKFLTYKIAILLLSEDILIAGCEL